MHWPGTAHSLIETKVIDVTSPKINNNKSNPKPKLELETEPKTTRPRGLRGQPKNY